MRRPDATLFALACMTTLVLGGCATTPRSAPAPHTETGGYSVEPAVAALNGGDIVQRIASDDAVPTAWWNVFGSAQLDSLVEQAHRANPGLQAIRASLRAAEELVLAQRGALFPTADLQYAPTRTKLAGNQAANAPGVQGDGTAITGLQGRPASQGGTAPFNAPVTYTYHTAQVNVGFQPDVFGVARGQFRAAQADATAQRLEGGAARLALEAQVIAAAIQDGLLRQQLAIATRQQSTAREMLALSRHQRRSGLVGRGDLAAQESSAAQWDATLPPLQRQLALNQDLLRTLCGLAQDQPLPAFDLDAFTVPERLPMRVPSQLVARRPDVRAAAADLDAASLRAGVAHRARLPQLSLNASLGGTAARFDQMFWGSGTFFTLSADLLQPVFRGGALKHQDAAARAQADAAADRYRANVLRAFQDVADSLHALESDAATLQATLAQRQAAASAQEAFERRRALGDIDRSTALAATLLRDQAELAWIQARAARLADTTALFVALGGDITPRGVQP